MPQVAITIMKRSKKEKPEATKQAVDTALRACLIAKDAAFNAGDYIGTDRKLLFCR